MHDILGETNAVEVSALDLDRLSETIEKFEGLERVDHQNGSLMAYLKEGQSSDHLNRFCFDQGIELKKLIPQSKSLEQEFLKILKEND